MTTPKCNICWMPLEDHERCQPEFKESVIEQFGSLLESYEEVGITREFMAQVVLEELLPAPVDETCVRMVGTGAKERRCKNKCKMNGHCARHLRPSS